jgi:hypothetical protein
MTRETGAARFHSQVPSMIIMPFLILFFLHFISCIFKHFKRKLIFKKKGIFFDLKIQRSCINKHVGV